MWSNRNFFFNYISSSSILTRCLYVCDKSSNDQKYWRCQSQGPTCIHPNESLDRPGWNISVRQSGTYKQRWRFRLKCRCSSHAQISDDANKARPDVRELLVYHFINVSTSTSRVSFDYSQLPNNDWCLPTTASLCAPRCVSFADEYSVERMTGALSRRSSLLEQSVCCTQSAKESSRSWPLDVYTRRRHRFWSC